MGLGEINIHFKCFQLLFQTVVLLNALCWFVVLFPVCIINASQVQFDPKGTLSVNSVLLNTSTNVSNVDLKKIRITTGVECCVNVKRRD